MNNMQYEPVIGLEIHVEIKTKSKMFCGCNANHFGVKPNTHCCPVCLGLPGALPVPNKRAIEWCVLLGKALDCKISSFSKFDRKNYFYPDLAKGYQISQYDEPIATNGSIVIATPLSGGSNPVNIMHPIGNEIATSRLKVGTRNDTMIVRIHRVHMEEDTGKLIHKDGDTLVDFNRSGVPLVEIVTEPDFHSSEDVVIFLKELHTIIRYLNISDADMEKGTMRMEPNISVGVVQSSKFKDQSSNQIQNSKLPNYKVEVKNINSFNYVKRAIEYEVKRHIEILEKGETPIQETRGWNSEKNITYSQRTKEDAHDYRYFPEPDIPPFEFSDEYIESIAKTIPELPQQKMDRFIKNFKLKDSDAFILTRDKDLAKKFESVLLNPEIIKIKVSPQEVANLFLNKLRNKLSLFKTDQALIEEIISIIRLKGDIKSSLVSIPDEVFNKIIQANPKVITDYKSGKQNAIMFLVGQVMKEMRGKADAKLVIEALKQKLT